MNFAATFSRAARHRRVRRLGVAAALVFLLGGVAGIMLVAAPAGERSSRSGGENQPVALSHDAAHGESAGMGDLGASTWAFDASLFEEMGGDAEGGEPTSEQLALAMVSEEGQGTPAGANATSPGQSQGAPAGGTTVLSTEEIAQRTQPAGDDLIDFLGATSIAASGGGGSNGSIDPLDEPEDPQDPDDPVNPTVIPSPTAAIAGLALFGLAALRRRG